MSIKHELAWAAGFFDGEGTVYGYVPRQRHARRVQIAVYQATPPLLQRFQTAVGGHGAIYGPYRGRLFHWSTKRLDAVSRVVAAIWPELGPEKRRQVEVAVAGRSDLEDLLAKLGRLDTPRDSARRQTIDLAWAAGLFDGEGSVTSGLAAVPCLEISQASTVDAPPGALLRFHAAVGSLGHISGPRGPSNAWSKLPQYRWRATSFEDVQATLAMVWPWLGPEKRSEAKMALAGYLDRIRGRRF